MINFKFYVMINADIMAFFTDHLPAADRGRMQHPEKVQKQLESDENI